MNKHTPGPWGVINSTGVFSALGADSGDGTKADSSDGWNICDCSIGVTSVDGEHIELGFAVQKANAKLIAAAPDLLDALIESRQVIATALKVGAPDWFDTDDKVAQHTTIKKIDAAIAKATQ